MNGTAQLADEDSAPATLARCPRCVGALVDFRCMSCGQRYPVSDGIPQLYAPNEWPADRRDVTDVVKAFYEGAPFPTYDDLDSRASLAAEAGSSVFARLLDEQIPPGATVLEAGCGTGQM